MNKEISTTITEIPLPSIILRGDWHDIVYSIWTDCDNAAEHNDIVEKQVELIREEFDNKSHYTVSLREVKRELVFTDERVKSFCTLVQFRIRDIY